jgi:hypothetical protein
MAITVAQICAVGGWRRFSDENRHPSRRIHGLPRLSVAGVPRFSFCAFKTARILDFQGFRVSASLEIRLAGIPILALSGFPKIWL